MNGDYHVDEQTFRSLDASKQNWMMYQTFNEYRVSCEQKFTDTEKDITDLATRFDRRKKWDSGAASVTGFIGGFIAFFFSKLLK
jgi:hypothetical protein